MNVVELKSVTKRFDQFVPLDGLSPDVAARRIEADSIDVAIDFPDLQLVMAHGGRPLYMEEAFFILRRHGKVRLDVSGIPPSKLLEYFPRLTELTDRVLWGTDWPSPGVKDLRQNIDQFLTLPLTKEQQQAILETNALALFPVEP